MEQYVTIALDEWGREYQSRPFATQAQATAQAKQDVHDGWAVSATVFRLPEYRPVYRATRGERTGGTTAYAA